MKLIEFMESLPRSANEKFDMGAWVQHDGEDHEHPVGQIVDASKDLKHCGTSACALGWATAVPSFRKAGLKVWSNPHNVTELNLENFDAAAAFFGLTQDQSFALFGSPDSDTDIRHAKTPKQWAKGARKLMREWKSAR